MALGGLASWHGRLISNGETSIEGNINKTEFARLASYGRIYVNPYHFGSRKNWRIFLGLVGDRYVQCVDTGMPLSYTKELTIHIVCL